MSGGIWIKMRRAISSDPDVFKIAELTGLDRFSVVGRLHAIWSWADEHNVADRDAVSVTQSYVDHVTECDGFADAMRRVGWLAGPDGELEFPDFDRHNGAAAKRKGQTALRNRKLRSKAETSDEESESQKHDAPSVTNASPDKDKDIDKEGGRKPAAAGVPLAGLDEFVVAWKATGLRECRKLTDSRRQKLRSLLADPDWRTNWRGALSKASKLPFCCGTNERGWVADIDWFLKADTVTQILEGKFDDHSTSSKRLPDDGGVMEEHTRRVLEEKRREQTTGGAS